MRTKNHKTRRNHRVRRGAGALAVATLGLLLLTMMPLPASAGGTDPTPSGTYDRLRKFTYQTDDKTSHIFGAWKLLTESDPADDYYAATVTMKQLDDKALFDNARFWLAGWARDDQRPDMEEWEPNTQDFGDDAVSLAVGAGGGGASMSIGWTHHWGLDFEAAEHINQEYNEGAWLGKLHQAHGDASWGGEWKWDWSSVTFGASFRIAEDAAEKYIAYGTYIQQTSTAWSDCWWPCHDEGTKCEPCERFYIPEEDETEICQSGTIEAATSNSGQATKTSMGGDDGPPANVACGTVDTSTVHENVGPQSFSPILPHPGDVEDLLEALDACGFGPQAAHAMVNDPASASVSDTLRIKTCINSGG